MEMERLKESLELKREQRETRYTLRRWAAAWSAVEERKGTGLPEKNIGNVGCGELCETSVQEWFTRGYRQCVGRKKRMGRHVLLRI